MKDVVISLITAALGTLGFSILFYVHPRRLTLATLGGVLTTAMYLLAGHFLGGELLPNLLGALVGAGFSDVNSLVGNLTKASRFALAVGVAHRVYTPDGSCELSAMQLL